MLSIISPGNGSKWDLAITQDWGPVFLNVKQTRGMGCTYKCSSQSSCFAKLMSLLRQELDNALQTLQSVRLQVGSQVNMHLTGCSIKTGALTWSRRGYTHACKSDMHHSYKIALMLLCGVARAFLEGQNEENWRKNDGNLKKVELLPTRNCEAGYTPNVPANLKWYRLFVHPLIH